VWNPFRRRAYYKVRSGVAAAREGRLDEAEQHFCQALNLDHECSEARLWLGHVYEQRLEPTKALTQYRLGLLFEPESAELQQAVQRAEASALSSDTKAARQLRGARSRRIVNLIFAFVTPCAGFFMGLWEMASAEVPEWRELGLRTMLCSLLGFLLQFALVVIIVLIAGAGG
jgi:hypothetical protein